MTISALFERERPLIMGILNITPDSFSDGGAYFNDPEAIYQHVAAMTGEGVDIIDIGGESTRPGARPISADEQMRRIIPVMTALKAHPSFNHIFLSVDTTQSVVARAAIHAGAGMINDVSAGEDDPDMFTLVAELGVPIVLMHKQGSPQTMQENPSYGNVVVEVKQYLATRAEAALAAGIKPGNIILDPGIGFGKTKLHNLQLMSSLGCFVELGFPVLLGASRKRFMGSVCQEDNPLDLIGATVATTVVGVMAGVRLFRVHDVKANRQAAQVAFAVLSSQSLDADP